MYSTFTPVAGRSPLDMTFTPDTTQRYPLMTMADGVDPFFGYGRFVYGKAAAAMNVGRLCTVGFDGTMTEVANAVGVGIPLFVARQTFSNASEWGWYQCFGLAPIQTANSVAIGTGFGIAAAGKGGTIGNGKQIVNASVVKASTYAPTKAGCILRLGADIKRIRVPNTEGLFPGLAVTGTGVGASAVIVTVNANGNEITVDVDSTAAGTVTLTFTWTNFLMVMLNNPFGQGQIV